MAPIGYEFTRKPMANAKITTKMMMATPTLRQDVGAWPVEPPVWPLIKKRKT